MVAAERSLAPSGRPARASLRTRFVVAIAALVAVVVVALVGVLALSSRRALRRDLEARAEGFAGLAAAPICTAYETYYASGNSKFREIVGDVAARNPDLADLAIYDTRGRRLFGSEELAESSFRPRRTGSPPASDDARVLAGVRGLEMVAWESPEAGRYTVVMPHIEEWGRHRYTVVFGFSYESLDAAMRAAAVRLAWPTLGSLLLGLGIAMLLARQSLGPLERLTRGAEDLADGHLDRPIDVRTGDEFQVLAEAFNRMAARLAAILADLEGANRELLRSNAELLEGERVKSDLLANVSHELRTPLTAIRGYNEALQEELLGPLSPPQREALEASARNIGRLLALIEELLSFARDDGRSGAFAPTPVDLVALASDRVSAVRAGRPPGAPVRIVTDASVPTVWGDADRLAQVLDNLLTNALKFTPLDGRVELRLRTEERDVVVEVADTGIGIPPEQRSRIFERFYQVESAANRRFGGIGLGLAIVRQILDAHGCAIEVESAPGEGATFRFRLPRADVAARPEPGARRVAVIEPDTELATGVADRLRRLGAWVRTADSFAGASRLVAGFHPEAVVLERLLPDGDGFDLLARWPDRGTMPIVMTLSPRRESALARRLGAVTHLVKPVTADSVVATLAHYWDGARGPAPADLASQPAAE